MDILEDIVSALYRMEKRIVLRIDELDERIKAMGAGLSALQAEDTALSTEVATFLADVVTAINNALASSDSDAAVAQVASDIQAQITNLQNGDPVTGLTPGT
jgi:hypothetical protein